MHGLLSPGFTLTKPGLSQSKTWFKVKLGLFEFLVYSLVSTWSRSSLTLSACGYFSCRDFFPEPSFNHGLLIMVYIVNPG